MKHLDELDSTVPIAFGSGGPLVVKMGTKNDFTVLWKFFHLDYNISITLCLIFLSSVPNELS
jgi:hypothetical protein